MTKPLKICSFRMTGLIFIPLLKIVDRAYLKRVR